MVAEQFAAVDHHAFVALRRQLVDHRPLHERRIAVLDQLFVTEGLLEFAHLDLKGVPVMDVQIGIGDRLGDRRPGEVGQQAELVVLQHRGFDAQSGTANQKRVRDWSPC